MEPIRTVKIPQSHVEFAKAIAELADKYGMFQLSMEYEPDTREPYISGCRGQGRAKISYRSKDGRGRLCRNLSISFESLVIHEIEKNQESSS